MHDDRHGARQHERFNTARAAILDDPSRLAYVPPETLLAELVPPLASTLVDFGAGTGLYAIALARLRPDLRILALDEQPPMLERLREAVADAGTSSVEVIEPAALPALRAGVERVLALNVLHELGDAALGDLRTLLTPDGLALFVDWNAEVERPVGPPSDHVYAPREAKERLEMTGFSTEWRTPLAYHYVVAARREN